MSATIIPADRLETLRRRRRGMVVYSLRRCLTCSCEFRTTNAAQCVCGMARHREWEFRK